MTYGQFALFVIKEIEGIYGYREARSIQRYIFSFITNKPATDLLLIQDEEIDSEFENRILKYLPELKAGVPVQYVVGKTWFLDIPLLVTPEVLIPRPETEELVNMVIKENQRIDNLNILDIGTGSGAIAIALAKYLRPSKITAIDISEGAIIVAKKNAVLNQTDVNFLKMNILDSDTTHSDYPIPIQQKFDIIVSNPPYVKESEKDLMQANVLDHEPHTALFVSDEDPLIFYRAIFKFSELHLAENGYIYLEVNEYEAGNFKELSEKFGFCNIEIRQDLHSKNRFVKAWK